MKIYYDNSRLNEIDYQLDSGNPSKALVLSDEYIEEYPSDILGPLYKARALVEMGETDNIEELLGDVFIEYTRDVRAMIMGYTQLGNIYVECDKQDEAIEAFESAISLEDVRNGFLSLKARSGLINLYIKNKELDKALELIDNTNALSENTFKPKRAYVYYLQGKYKDALQVLDECKETKKSTAEQFVNYLYGRCYFSLEQFDKSEEYLKKCLNIKNIIYYKACYYLSGVYVQTNRLEMALNYANQIKNCPELKDNEIRAKFRIYLKLGYLDEAKELMEKPESEFYKNYLKMKYYYTVKDYDKAIEYATHMLNDDDIGLFNIAAQIYILSYMKKGEYDYAKSLIPYFFNDIDQLSVHQILSYISSKQGDCSYEEPGMYNCQQLFDYNEDRAIEHVMNRHLNDFDDEDFILDLFDRKDELLANQTCLSDNIFDKYIIPYRGVGSDENGVCNTLIVITNPDTHDIITLFPLSGCEVYDKKQSVSQPKKKVKRPTAMEKFILKYGYR